MTDVPKATSASASSSSSASSACVRYACTELGEFYLKRLVPEGAITRILVLCSYRSPTPGTTEKKLRTSFSNQIAWCAANPGVDDQVEWRQKTSEEAQDILENLDVYLAHAVKEEFLTQVDAA